MVKIEGNNISMIRGDTLELEIQIMKSDGNIYIPQTGDSLKFTLKRYYTDVEALIQKEIPIDTMLLRIESQETKKLDFGNYDYDIELTTHSNKVDTIIPWSTFCLLPEVG